ncbi:MAG: methyltransferase domain-containing protein [Alphaproteobacteria bacterium]|nr:methyltransferase domain-containing protein [Alphaproteobacteria bacterium]
MTASLKHLVKRNRWTAAAAYVGHDFVQGLRLRLGDLASESGATHARFSLAESLAYLDRVHDDYVSFARTLAGVERLAGTIAEVGPGDSYGVAVRLLADGAEAVHAIDRFVQRIDRERDGAIYEALAARPGVARVFDGSPAAGRIKGLSVYRGKPAEEHFAAPPGRYDAILSRAVLEHLQDPLLGLDRMAAALRPGGVMVHVVDLSDHGMFEGHHPLTFLTLPDPIYRLMVRNSGRPNRVVVADYRAWLERSGLAGALQALKLVGDGAVLPPSELGQFPAPSLAAAEARVAQVRARMPERLRKMAPADLAVSSFVLVARRAMQRAG